METEENKINTKAIYWVVAVLPIIFINLLPYLGISYPEQIDSDEVFYNLVLWFSAILVFFLIGMFACYKCIIYSEIIPTKVMASLFLLFYLIVVIAMTYFFFNGYIGGR